MQCAFRCCTLLPTDLPHPIQAHCTARYCLRLWRHSCTDGSQALPTQHSHLHFADDQHGVLAVAAHELIDVQVCLFQPGARAVPANDVLPRCGSTGCWA